MVTRTRYRSPGSIITAIAGLIAGIIVLGIILVLVDANQRNTIVDFILDIGRFFARPFEDLFPQDDPKENIVINWGHRGAGVPDHRRDHRAHRPPRLTPGPRRPHACRQRPPGQGSLPVGAAASGRGVGWPRRSPPARSASPSRRGAGCCWPRCSAPGWRCSTPPSSTSRCPDRRRTSTPTSPACSGRSTATR